jgi:hypothetical protein
VNDPQPRWRISSYSSNNGSCVAVADLAGAVGIRNSNHPDRGTLSLDRSAMAAFVAGCATGELDDLA